MTAMSKTTITLLISAGLFVFVSCAVEEHTLASKKTSELCKFEYLESPGVKRIAWYDYYTSGWHTTDANGQHEGGPYSELRFIQPGGSTKYLRVSKDSPTDVLISVIPQDAYFAADHVDMINFTNGFFTLKKRAQNCGGGGWASWDRVLHFRQKS
jgi:hypothetical protein